MIIVVDFLKIIDNVKHYKSLMWRFIASSLSFSHFYLARAKKSLWSRAAAL